MATITKTRAGLALELSPTEQSALDRWAAEQSQFVGAARLSVTGIEHLSWIITNALAGRIAAYKTVDAEQLAADLATMPDLQAQVDAARKKKREEEVVARPPADGGKDID